MNNPEMELRALWTARGVPRERQNEMIAQITTASPAYLFTLDQTPAGKQHVLPGAEPIGAGALAARQAAAPLKPRKEQAPCDVGLFSDAANQLDLVDLARRPTMCVNPNGTKA